MKQKLTASEAIRESAIINLLEALLKVEFNQITPLYRTMLVEVLINGKTFTELKETVNLTTNRQKVVFQDAVKILKKKLESLDEHFASYKAIEEDLHHAQRAARGLESELTKIKSISPVLKKKLAIPIAKTDFSSRVQQICSSADIHTIADLVCFSRREFLNLRNCGKLSADEVEAYLEKNGLSWKMIK